MNLWLLFLALAPAASAADSSLQHGAFSVKPGSAWVYRQTYPGGGFSKELSAGRMLYSWRPAVVKIIGPVSLEIVTDLTAEWGPDHPAQDRLRRYTVYGTGRLANTVYKATPKPVSLGAKKLPGLRSVFVMPTQETFMILHAVMPVAGGIIELRCGKRGASEDALLEVCGPALETMDWAGD